MITDFKQFGLIHMASLLMAFIVGLLFIIWAFKAHSSGAKRKLSLLVALVIILIRGSRYIMDIIYGRFEWADLFSLQICHIDLVLLIICLIKPSEGLFNFNFMIGIPMGLAVALMPGTNHPAPGLPRAVLFIMSHMMLVMGALYVAAAERLKPRLKYFLIFAGAGNAGIMAIYVVNRLLGTNFLYIMSAPEGTVIEQFYKIFGWPGYVFAMDALALLLMSFMLVVPRLTRFTNLSHLRKKIRLFDA